MSKSKEERMRAAQEWYDNFDVKSYVEKALARLDRRAPYEADAIKTEEQMAVDAMIAKAARAQIAELDVQITALKEKHEGQLANIKSKEQTLEELMEYERSIRKLENYPSTVSYKDGSKPGMILRAAGVPVSSTYSDEGIGYLIADHDNKVTMVTKEYFKETFHFVDNVTGEPVDFEKIEAVGKEITARVERESALRFPEPVKEQKTEGPDEEAT